MYLNLAINSVIFGIFFTLLFLFLQKIKIWKVNFASMFFFTTIVYFILTLFLSKFLQI